MPPRADLLPGTLDLLRGEVRAVDRHDDGGTQPGVILTPPKQISQREHDAENYYEQHEQPDQMPALQYKIAAAFFLSRCHLLFFSPDRLNPLVDDVNRQWEHDRRILLDANFGQCLQIAELQGRRLRRDSSCGVGKLL